MKKSILSAALFSALVGISSFSVADNLVIISSPENVEQLNLDDVARIFLGKVTQYPSGETVEPIDIDPTHPSYERFAQIVLNKSPSQLRAYWAKQIFTGKGRPPQVVASARDLQDIVASDSRYLSYINSEDIENDLRWIIELE